jgi:hypothetical protein
MRRVKRVREEVQDIVKKRREKKGLECTSKESIGYHTTKHYPPPHLLIG